LFRLCFLPLSTYIIAHVSIPQSEGKTAVTLFVTTS